MPRRRLRHATLHAQTPPRPAVPRMDFIVRTRGAPAPGSHPRAAVALYEGPREDGWPRQNSNSIFRQWGGGEYGVGHL